MCLLLRHREENESEVQTIDDELKAEKIKLASLLGVPELLVCFCSNCGVSEFHSCHILEENDDGVVYR